MKPDLPPPPTTTTLPNHPPESTFFSKTNEGKTCWAADTGRLTRFGRDRRQSCRRRGRLPRGPGSTSTREQVARRPGHYAVLGYWKLSSQSRQPSPPPTHVPLRQLSAPRVSFPHDVTGRKDPGRPRGRHHLGFARCYQVILIAFARCYGPDNTRTDIIIALRPWPPTCPWPAMAS